MVVALLGMMVAAQAPAMHTAPITLADHYRINVVRRTTGQGAIAHPDGTKVLHIIEGTATFVSEGQIVRAAGAPAGAATIEGGESRRVVKGGCDPGARRHAA